MKYKRDFSQSFAVNRILYIYIYFCFLLNNKQPGKSSGIFLTFNFICLEIMKSHRIHDNINTLVLMTMHGNFTNVSSYFFRYFFQFIL